MLRIGCYLGYFLILFYFESLPGNPFKNGIIFSLADIASMILTGILIELMDSMIVFRICMLSAISGCCGLIFI